MLDRVNDTANHTPTAQEKEAEQKFMEAQDAFQGAFRAYIEAAMDYGWEIGWTNGYDAGWDAAFEHLRKQEQFMRQEARAARPRAPEAPQASLPFLQLSSSTERRTAAENVLDYIQRMPGQRGVDIANALAATSPPTPERTVRTALHRLKMDNKIKVIDGKWYTADHEPVRRI